MKKNFLLILVSIFSLIASAQKNIHVTIAGKKYIVPEFKQDSVLPSVNFIVKHNILASIKESKADLEIRSFDYNNGDHDNPYQRGTIWVLKGWRDSLHFEKVYIDGNRDSGDTSFRSDKLVDKKYGIFSGVSLITPNRPADSLFNALINMGLFSMDDYKMTGSILQGKGKIITDSIYAGRSFRYYKYSK